MPNKDPESLKMPSTTQSKKPAKKPLSKMDLAMQLFPAWFQHENLVKSIASLAEVRFVLAVLNAPFESPKVLEAADKTVDLLRKIDGFKQEQVSRVKDIQRNMDGIQNKIQAHDKAVERGAQCQRKRDLCYSIPEWEREEDEEEDEPSELVDVKLELRRLSAFRDRLRYEAVIFEGIATAVQKFLVHAKLRDTEESLWARIKLNEEFLKDFQPGLATSRRLVVQRMKSIFDETRGKKSTTIVRDIGPVETSSSSGPPDYPSTSFTSVELGDEKVRASVPKSCSKEISLDLILSRNQLKEKEQASEALEYSGGLPDRDVISTIMNSVWC